MGEIFCLQQIMREGKQRKSSVNNEHLEGLNVEAAASTVFGNMVENLKAAVGRK